MILKSRDDIRRALLDELQKKYTNEGILTLLEETDMRLLGKLRRTGKDQSAGLWRASFDHVLRWVDKAGYEIRFTLVRKS